MDFKQFRKTGELSDINITVGEKSFKLHKFPLYIRSEYFKTLVQGDGSSGGGEQQRENDNDNTSGIIDLEDFPGGPKVFEMVADFCYNLKIDITRENVCQLRCAAEYLQMSSPGNLARMTDRYLDDVLASAKLNRNVTAISEMMLNCLKMEEISDRAGVVNKCINAIVDFWSKPTSKFTTLSKVQECQELVNLSPLPLNWVMKIIKVAQEKDVNVRILIATVQRYITKALIRVSKESPSATEIVDDETSDVTEQNDAQKDKQEDGKTDTSEEILEGGDEESNLIKDDATQITLNVEGETSQEICPEKDYKLTDHDEKADKERGEKETDLKLTCHEIEKWSAELREEIKEILDTLLFALPEDSPYVEIVSAPWVAETLKVADCLGCNSRDLLISIACKLLQRFAASDLIRIRPAVLYEVVQRAAADRDSLPGTVCGVLDNYLFELAQSEQLAIDDFRQLANAVPSSYRPSHDALFQVLELLLQTAKTDIDEEQKKDLFDIIDFKRLSEETLERAYDGNLIPPAYVTKAALALCKKLRVELDNARAVIKNQEEELTQKSRQLAAVKSKPWLRHADSGSSESKVSKYSGTKNSYGVHSSPHTPSRPSTLSTLSPRSHSMMVDLLDKSPSRVLDTKYMYTPYKSYLYEGDSVELDSAYDYAFYRRYFPSRPLYL